jgi:hypothetical protein
MGIQEITKRIEYIKKNKLETRGMNEKRNHSNICQIKNTKLNCTMKYHTQFKLGISMNDRQQWERKIDQ